MFVLALALAAAPARDQILAGPAFESFARRTERLCPARHLRAITPGDLDFTQDAFQERLSPARRTELAAANRGGVRCAGRNGLSCPTGETLAAMARTRMLDAFARFACSRR